MLGLSRLLLFFKPSVSIPDGGLKLMKMMLCPCSQGTAGCRIAEQHWSASPAPKLADTND